MLTISVFAWTTGQAELQGALLGNPAARLNLAQQAAAAVRARGADGINLDFEPIASGYDDEFTAFVRTVRAELDKQASGLPADVRHDRLHRQLPDRGRDGARRRRRDLHHGLRLPRPPARRTPARSTRLSGPAYDLQDTINAYAARVSPSKLILGVPWYGRAWSTVSDAVNAKNQSGTKYGSSNTVILDTALDYAKQYGRRWDSRELSAWVAYQKQNCSATYGCVTTWRELYYDDGPAVKARYDMINRMGLRGAGIWALGYDVDRIEMRQALAEKFLDDRTAPLAGDPGPRPEPVGRVVHRLLDRLRRERHPRLRRPGLDPRWAVARLADQDDRDHRPVRGRRRLRLRVPGPGPRHPRQRVGVGRHERLPLPPLARRRRVRRRSSRRRSTSDRRRTPARRCSRPSTRARCWRSRAGRSRPTATRGTR